LFEKHYAEITELLEGFVISVVNMGDYESAYFYEVFPREITTVEYVTKEDL